MNFYVKFEFEYWIWFEILPVDQKVGDCHWHQWFQRWRNKLPRGKVRPYRSPSQWPIRIFHRHLHGRTPENKKTKLVPKKQPENEMLKVRQVRQTENNDWHELRTESTAETWITIVPFFAKSWNLIWFAYKNPPSYLFKLILPDRCFVPVNFLITFSLSSLTTFFSFAIWLFSYFYPASRNTHSRTCDLAEQVIFQFAHRKVKFVMKRRLKW